MAVLDIQIEAQNKAKRALQQVSGQLDDLNKSAQGANSRLGNVRNTMQKGVVAAGTAVVGATTLVGGALLGVAANGTRMAADLEAQMSGIGALLGKTNEEVEPLKETILDLGMDPALKVDAQEAANSVEMLIRNGMTMEQVMGGAARSTVLLANATGADFGTAADIATDSMDIFNVAAEDMDKAVNSVTGVVNNSKFTIDDYRLAMAQAGGVASAVGVDHEDFNTSIAAIAPLFASGSDAGTSYKTMLQRLVPDTKDARQMMAELNLITEEGQNRFFDASGAMKDMDEIAGLLQGALEGLSEEQTNQALKTIFGTDAMRAAVGLARTGKDDFNELKDTIGDTDAEEAAATRMDNLRGAIDIARGVIETISLRIGELFIPALTSIVRNVSTFLEEHSDAFIGFFETLIEEVPNAVTEMGRFASSIRNVWERAEEAIQPVTDLVTEFVEWKDVLIALGIGLGILFAPAILGLIGSLLGLVGTVAVVGAAFSGLVLAVAGLRTAWENDWGGIQTKTENAIEAIETALKALPEWLETNIPNALDALQTKWDEVWGVLAPRVQAVSDAITPILTSIQSWFLVKIPLALGAMGLVFSTAWSVIQTSLQNAWTNMGPNLESFLSWFETDLPTALETAQTAFETGIGAIKDALDDLQTKWNEVWDVIEPRVQTAWDTIRPILETMRTWLMVNIPVALAALGLFFSGAWTMIQEAVSNAWTNMAPNLESILTWFETDLPDAVTSAKDSVSTQVQNIITKIDELTQPIQDIVGEFVSWKDIVVSVGILLTVTLLPAIGGAIAALGGLATSISVGPIAAFLALIATVSLVRNAWERDWGGIQDKTEEAIQAIKDAIDGLMELFQPEFEALSEAFQEMFSEFSEMGPELQALWTSMRPILAGIGAALTTVASIFGVVLVFAIKFFVQNLSGAMRMAADIVKFQIEQMTDTFNTIVEVWGSTVELVQALIDGDFSAAWESAKDIASAFQGFWLRTMVRIWALAGIYFTQVKNTVTRLLDSLNVDAKAVMDGFRSWWSTTFESIWLLTGTWFKIIKTVVTQRLEKISTAAKEIMDGFRSWWSTIFESIWGLTKTWFLIIKTVITDRLEATSTAASAIMETFKSWWLRTIRGLWSTVTRYFNAIKNTVTTALNAVDTQAKAILETIKGWWDGMWSNLAKAVEPVSDTILGIIDAIASARQNLEDFKAWVEGLTIQGPDTEFGSVGGGASGSFGPTQGQAHGTSSFRGVLATINERGPEALILPGRNRQMMLPQGTQIVSARDTAAAMSGGGDIHVHMDGMVISSDMDAESFAWRVANIIQRSQRGRR